MQSIPLDERPRERLLKHGPEALSTAELVAVILGSGMKEKPVLQLAQDVVAHFGSMEKLVDATIEELCQIKGLGRAKAIQLRAAFALGIRAANTADQIREKLHNPMHVYRLVKEMFQREKKERFVVLLQDVKGCLVHMHTITIGTLSHNLVHPREVFYPAIRHTAASIILSHNHPSGDPTPSADDIATTIQLVAAGKTMGIPVRDHLIVGDGAFISLRQEGLVDF